MPQITGLSVAVLLLSVVPSQAQPPEKEVVPPRPVGTWRAVGDTRGMGATIEIKENRLRWLFPAGYGSMTVTLEADYSITKDSYIYGIVTRLD